MTNRRPSDEASMILRKISGAGMPFGMMNLGVSLPDKTMSLPPFPRNPMENSSFQDFLDLAKQPQILGLGDTGRMLTTAFSDSFLPGIGYEDSSHHTELSPHPMDDRRTISPEETLLPPLTQQDRHPSAPQLANLLTAESSSSGNKPDVMLTEEVPARKRSWSMPTHHAMRVNPRIPGISISSPEDPNYAQDMFFERPPVTIGEPTSYDPTIPFGDLNRPDDINKCLQQVQLPSDPTQWTEDQVYRWAEWVAQEFNLATVNLQALRGVTGHQLCSFGQRQFQELAYIKEHGLTLQHFLERIKAISVGKSITLCDSEPVFHDVSRWYFGMS